MWVSSGELVGSERCRTVCRYVFCAVVIWWAQEIREGVDCTKISPASAETNELPGASGQKKS